MSKENWQTIPSKIVMNGREYSISVWAKVAALEAMRDMGIDGDNPNYEQIFRTALITAQISIDDAKGSKAEP